MKVSALVIVVFAAAFITCQQAGAETAATSGPAVKADPKAALGAEGFVPSADRPVGWRGDWTGRYPGATPPTAWSRTAVGATAGLLNQSNKPAKGSPSAAVAGAEQKADGPAAAQPVRFGIVREWLVIGPFPAADPAKDIDQEQAAGEAQLQPTGDEKVGSLAWKPLHVSMETQTLYGVNEGACGQPWVNFEYLFGQTTNQVVYAHTYLFSPTGGKAELEFDFVGEAAKVWLNGSPLKVVNKSRQAQRMPVELVKGWNRLLVKVAYGTPASKQPQENIWRSYVRVLPSGPIAYESKNVAWMTYLPGTTTSHPVVVGSRIIAAFGSSDLICLNKADGKILWLRPNYQYDAMTEAEVASYPDLKAKVDPLLAKMKQMNDDVVAQLNAAVSPTGVAPDKLNKLKDLLRQKDTLDKSIHDAVSVLDRKKYPKLYESEVSSCDATPCTDGKLVYTVYGGGRDVGGCLVVCYDMEGNRRWSFYEALGAGEHSNHASPLLVGDTLIHTANKTILGFDAKTGKVKWRQMNPKWYLVESSAWPVQVGATKAVAVDMTIVRPTDGALLWNGSDNFWHIMWHVPIFENGTVYSLGCQRGHSSRECFTAVQLTEKSADQWDARIQWKIKKSEILPTFKAASYDADHIASPLYHDGLLYTVDMMGLLLVLDAKTGERVYQRTLDMDQLCNRFDYGICASPTLGGKRILLMDGMGGSLVLEPGPKYKEVSRSVLEDFDGPLWGGQERFFTSPVFDGSSILIRGRGYIYCIREK